MVATKVSLNEKKKEREGIIEEENVKSWKIWLARPLFGSWKFDHSPAVT